MIKRRLCAFIVACMLLLSMPVAVLGGPGGDPGPPRYAPCPPIECPVELPVILRGPGGDPGPPCGSGPIRP